MDLPGDKVTRSRVIRGSLFLAALLPYAFLFADGGQAPKPSFGRDVMPILKAHCVSCHSGEMPAGHLDLSTAKALQKAARMIVAGDPKASILMQRIHGVGGKPQMPMGFAPLTAAQMATMDAWIAAGASFDEGGVKQHWAYIAPERPKVPKLDSKWVRNPIDAFVLARLRKEGLHPSPEAAKETLIRRVSLDLTGLPPTPAEIDGFLADKSPNAYEKVVDRLLASPHFGEKQAQGWLDLARYADTDGYEKDLRRTAFKYRDWVIDAFNANMPYDRFTVEQLAGDLLPNASLSQLVATGFHRNSLFNREGGVDQEEAHFAVITDRVDTTATVWLGSTMACARCHDHKYDPFSQKDYYKMAALWSNTVVIPRGPKDVGEEKWFEPEISVPTSEQAKEQQRLLAETNELTRRLQLPSPALDAAYEHWKSEALRPTDWKTLTPGDMTSSSGTKLNQDAEGAILASGTNPARDDYKIGLGKLPTPATGLRLEALPDPSLPNHGPGRAGNGNFVLTGLKIFADGKPVDVREFRADFIQSAYGVERLAQGDDRTGWAVNFGQSKPHEVVATFAQALPAGTHLSVLLEQHSPFDQHNLGRFRLSVTSANDPGASVLSQRARQLLSLPGRSQADEAELLAYFRSTTPLLADLRSRLAEDRRKLDEVKGSIATAMVMKENPSKGPLTAYVRRRGEFMSKAELVEAGAPSVLPPMKDARADRLTFARWLVSKDNPLTARVQINRMWESAFGRGLVETSEDFGTRGSPPSHPELLDWLACEFMSRGWDMKGMLRLMVTSSTYRQSSSATKALLAKDAQNVLLARGPRFRLPAETIRDAALAASGLLSPKVGGPSVFPSQPEGIWNSPFSGEQWMYSKGDDAHRRGLYTFLKRTAPYPAFMAFDSTSRESCTVRRIRTNTPLQALALLNDRAMIEAAAALGKRMQKAGPTDAERLVAGFRLCTSRRPTAAEVARLQSLLAKLEARYAAKPKDASTLGGGPVDAAWTMVGNVLLNLDETITKG